MIDKGYQESGVPVADMNRRFGKGKWRPLLLFCLDQGDKQRLIADAKKAGHNTWVSKEEKLLAISIDWAAQAAREILQLVFDKWNRTDVQDWLQLGLALADMSDAYRQVPIHPDPRRANIVSWYSSSLQEW